MSNVFTHGEHGKRQLSHEPPYDPQIVLVARRLKQLHQRLQGNESLGGRIDSERCPARTTLRVDENVRIKDHDIARP
jgi:hypothetical protein